MNTYLQFVIALLPIAWLVISLGGLKVAAHKASLMTLVIAAALAVTIWQMSFGQAVLAVLEGAAVGFWPIMIVIIAAIFTYNLALHTGSMDTIKRMLGAITTDRRIQVLLLAWAFGGFLEAVAGYGTAVAIPASILAALGFEPLFAAALCLIANTVPTAFGAVGIPVITLAKVTNLDVGILSYQIGIQLGIFIVLIPFVLVIMTTGSLKGLKGVVGITLASGISFAVPQVLAARYLGAELPALLGSLASMGTVILITRWMHRKKRQERGEGVSFKEGLKAWAPYILIPFFVILSSPLFPSIHDVLARAESSLLIYQGEGAQPTTFKWIVTPGTLIIAASVIGGLIQGAGIGEIVKVFGATFKQLVKSMITVLSIVAVAKVMGYSGMIASIAAVIVQVTGGLFPLIAPMIGTLGTFVTGSDTSSNILFGPLQTEVAKAIHVSPYWLAAANTSGATAGKMISPQSIAVATSAAGMVGAEGKIFNKTVKFCLGYVVLLGILVYIGSLLG